MGVWMISNVGVDRGNVHEMVWWQEEKHPVTGARKVFQSLLHAHPSISSFVASALANLAIN